MNHLSFNWIASLKVASDGWGQLALLFWAIPLMIFGMCFQLSNESDNPGGMITLSVLGAVFIGGWGQSIQRAALDYCQNR